MNSTEPTLPRSVLWLLLAVVAGSLSLVSAELLLRVVPGPWTSSFFYVYDPLVGTWHLPNFSGDNMGADYEIREIEFNSFGMRDRERLLAKDPGTTRIAFLGDSFVEGMQVTDEEVLTRRMEEMLGGKVEVLNFAVSGFGTLQEYLTYTERVRPFKPDIVILGYYAGNDARNNSEELETLYNGGTSDRPFIRKDTDGAWEIIPVPAKPASQNPVILFLKRHFALYRFAWYQKRNLFSGESPAPAPAPQESAPKESTNVYLTRLSAPPSGEPFSSAWEATERLLDMLKSEVERDGAKFVLVAIPDPVSMESDPNASLAKAYGEALPAAYDAEYPQKRLAAWTSARNIPYLDLTPILKAYRDEHALPFPYFSFAHDGHWSPLGHQVAASAIADYLKARRLIAHD